MNTGNTTKQDTSMDTHTQHQPQIHTMVQQLELRTRNHKSIQPTPAQKYQTSHHQHQQSYAGGQQRPINSIQHIYIIDVEILSK